jgi:WD40 repeat protein
VAISAGVGHTAAVKAVARIEDKDSSSSSTMLIVSGGKDRSVRLWKFDGSSRLIPLAIGIGHEDSVDAVATCKGSSELVCISS